MDDLSSYEEGEFSLSSDLSDDGEIYTQEAEGDDIEDVTENNIEEYSGPYRHLRSSTLLQSAHSINYPPNLRSNPVLDLMREEYTRRRILAREAFNSGTEYVVHNFNSSSGASTPELPPVTTSAAALAETTDGPSQNNSDVNCSSQCRRRSDISADDDGQTCTICFEPWTNTSDHRLVSLRCGHLFGRSCITRWLGSQNARCPQCNARARKSEIRNIYARTVKVMDSSERDRALQDLMKESEKKRIAEREAAHERLKHMLKVQECETLKKELMEAKQMLHEFRCNGILGKSQSAKMNSVFSLEKIIEISKGGGCRIMDVSDLLGMILVSQQSTNGLFPGYGLRKISTTELKPSEFMLIHNKPIKDIAFHCHDGLVLTASLDKTVKITNVLSNSVVQTYGVHSDAWSCAWDADNPIYFYSGGKTGDVYLYDIRVTNRHVHELPSFGYRTPVVSVQYISKTDCSRLSNCGPVVGKLSDCGFLQKSNEVLKHSVIPIPTAGPLSSLSSEPVSGNFLVSCRPSHSHPHLSHTLCELVDDPTGQGMLCNPIQTVQGGRNQVQLTRSKLLPHPDDASSLLICAGDEDAHAALIWDGSSGQSLDQLKTDSPVLDFAGLKTNHKSVLMTLTDTNLFMYGWKTQ